MRVIRYLDGAGVAGYARLRGEGVPPERLAGSLEAGFGGTGEAAAVERVLAPVEPPVIYGIGLNYRAHAVETGKEVPADPLVFMKAPGSVIGPGEAIVLPRHLWSGKVDFEVELAVVMGRACRNVGVDEALDCVAGYTVGNDVSARDWQYERGGGQFCKAKSFDTFCPLGPCLVTSEELGGPGGLRLRLDLNGERMQDGTSADMIFSVAELVSFLSGGMTLPVGAVILTGTPPGVGAGRTPPRFLRAGDRLRLEIEGIGVLENAVVEEG